MKSLKLTEADRKIIWIAFANADRKGATIEIIGKDLRLHCALDITKELDENSKDTVGKDYRLEDADYEHLTRVFNASVGWARVPEGIKPVLAADKAIKAAKVVDAKPAGKKEG